MTIDATREQYDSALAAATPLASQLHNQLASAKLDAAQWDTIMATMTKLEAAVRMADSRHRMIVFPD